MFGSFLGLLVFVYFVSRFVLFVTAWAATSKENEEEEPAEVPGPAVIRSEVVVGSRPSGGTTAGCSGRAPRRAHWARCSSAAADPIPGGDSTVTASPRSRHGESRSAR